MGLKIERTLWLSSMITKSSVLQAKHWLEFLVVLLLVLPACLSAAAAAWCLEFLIVIPGNDMHVV